MTEKVIMKLQADLQEQAEKDVPGADEKMAELLINLNQSYG